MMAARKRPTRRWALLATCLSAFGGFLLSTNPTDVQSNFSQWVEYVWPNASLPQWMIAQSIDTIGTWVTGVLALLSFVWFLEQYIPMYDWIRGNSTTSRQTSATTASLTRPISNQKNRRRKVFRRLSIHVRLLYRWAYRLLRLYLPWDYELPTEVYATQAGYFDNPEDDKIAFSNRFGDAFPGSTNLTTFHRSRHVISRLNVLLRWPLIGIVRRTGEEAHQINPFYWTDGFGNMHIRRFYQYKKNIVLLNEQEIHPSFMAAIRGLAYWQCFVYLEGYPMQPKKISGEVITRGQERQQFGIYGHKVISIGEYGDGSHLIRGQPRAFKHIPDTRSRDLIKRGFLLIPQSSTANKPKHDQRISQLIDEVVNDKSHINDLASFLLSLPKS